MATALPTAADLGARPDVVPQTAVTPVQPGGVEGALANAGEAISAIDDTMVKARRALQLTDAYGKATEALGTKVVEFQREQDFKTAPARFKAAAATIGTDIANGIDDPFVRRMFAEKFAPLAVANQLHVVQSAAKQEIDFGKGQLKDNLGAMAVGMANAESGFLKKSYEDMANSSIAEMRGTGIISDVEAVGMRNHFYQSYFLTKRDIDPVAAMKDLQANSGNMDPMVAAQLHDHLFRAAEPALANNVLKLLPFSTTTVTPDATAETLDNLKAAIRTRETGGSKDAANAVSPQGATGSMQIMPDTFAQYARPGESYGIEADRVAAADRKLADDWTFYKGDVRKVAAAYIGGRGAVTPDGSIRSDVKDSLGTTPAAYAAQVTTLMGAIRQSVVNNAIVGPGGALEEAVKNPQNPTGDPVVDALPLDQKIRVLQMAHTQAQQGLGQVKGALHADVQDAIAMYRDGKSPPNPPTADKLVLGLGPVDGMRAATALKQAEQYGQDVQTVTPLPTSDQLALLKTREAQLPQGAGYADAKKYLDSLGESVAQVQKQREQNASGFVLQNSPATRAAFDAVQVAQKPEDRALASQAYAESTLAEQNRLQIQNQKILTPQMVDGLAKQFAAPQGVDTQNVLTGMADQWGKYFPQVMHELRKSLPPGAIVIGLGIKPEAASLLSEGLKLKPEQIQQGFPDADVKTLTEAITKKFEPMRATVAYQQGGVETYDAYADGAKTLSLMMMQQGMKPKDAVDKAWDTMLDFKYSFDGNMRVPKEALGGTVSVPAIKQGANSMLRDIADTGALAVPDAGMKGVRPEDALAQWRQTVKSNGKWLTSPGDTGLTLYVTSGLGAQAVLDANHQPIRRTWKDLAETGLQYATAFYPNPQGIIGRTTPGTQ